MVSEINPVTRSKKQSQFIQTSINRFAVTELPLFHPRYPGQDALLSLPVQGGEPLQIRAFTGTILKNGNFILARLKQVVSLKVTDQSVNYT